MPACLRVRNPKTTSNGMSLAMIASVVSAVSVPTAAAAESDVVVEEKAPVEDIAAESTAAGSEGEAEDGKKAFDMGAFLAMLRGKPMTEEQIQTSIALCATKQQYDALELELASLRSPALNSFLANEAPNQEETETLSGEIAALLHATEPNAEELKSKVQTLYASYEKQSIEALEVNNLNKEMSEEEVKSMLARFNLRDKIASCKEKLAKHGDKWFQEMSGVHKEDREALIEALPAFKGFMPTTSYADRFGGMGAMGGDDDFEEMSAGSQDMAETSQPAEATNTEEPAQQE